MASMGNGCRGDLFRLERLSGSWQSEPEGTSDDILHLGRQSFRLPDSKPISGRRVIEGSVCVIVGFRCQIQRV